MGPGRCPVAEMRWAFWQSPSLDPNATTAGSSCRCPEKGRTIGVGGVHVPLGHAHQHPPGLSPACLLQIYLATFGSFARRDLIVNHVEAADMVIRYILKEPTDY